MSGDRPLISISFPLRVRLGGNVLLTGEQGSAKTSILNAFTGRYNPEERLYQKSNFSATTTPQIFQKTIETSVDKRMGNTFGPPIGKTMTIFIDDLNQPEVSAWGDQVSMPCHGCCLYTTFDNWPSFRSPTSSSALSSNRRGSTVWTSLATSSI